MNEPKSKEFIELQLQIDELKRQSNRVAVINVPNQNLTTSSNVVFNTVTVGAQATWTPSFAGSTIAGVFTYGVQSGYYINLGGIVFFWGRLAISAIGTPPTGIMYIAGLPLANLANYYGSVTFGFIQNFNYAAAAMQLTGIVEVSSQFIALYESFDNGAAVAAPAANFTNVNCNIIFSGFYRV